MERRIMKLPVHQLSLIAGISAAILGLAYLLVTLPAVLFGLSRMQKISGMEGMPGAGMMIGAALLYPLLAFPVVYIATAITVRVFNAVAKWMGGVSVQVDADEFR